MIRSLAALGTRVQISTACTRTIHTTSNGLASDRQQDWRYRQGLSRNPNTYGPLTDNRDFSYLDGRPAPLSVGQKKRLQKHKLLAEKIVSTVKEMEFAVERHARLQREAEEKRQAHLDSKLIPKGPLLLKKGKEGAP